MDKNTLAGYIDHTLLKPTATVENIIKLCDEAEAHHFCSVCIPPYFVETAVERLEKSTVKVCTVIGFPLGYQLTSIKIHAKRSRFSSLADDEQAGIRVPETGSTLLRD